MQYQSLISLNCLRSSEYVLNVEIPCGFTVNNFQFSIFELSLLLIKICFLCLYEMFNICCLKYESRISKVTWLQISPRYQYV